ncbi:hypothetical protein NLJ89_g9760 [Agrocybe chaxingu]|uniref:Uncharacterized protein n=1 Tax=Agrocybe chaxingu TaxID=84603 RepID=A0A9W8MPJ6_9AGAR|nr:hypothetical protein NLJ89_g9760 [Agrocybe chaxingu]
MPGLEGIELLIHRTIRPSGEYVHGHVWAFIRLHFRSKKTVSTFDIPTTKAAHEDIARLAHELALHRAASLAKEEDAKNNSEPPLLQIQQQQRYQCWSLITSMVFILLFVGVQLAKDEDEDASPVRTATLADGPPAKFVATSVSSLD